MALHFCDCLQKAVQVICYRIRELDTHFPQNLYCASFLGSLLEKEEEKNDRLDFRISLFSAPHLEMHTSKPLLLSSCSFVYNDCGVGEGRSKQCLGHHTSICLGEMLMMQVIHSALGELLVVHITWKYTQEFRIM